MNHSVGFSTQMALMKHRGLFELLETHGSILLDTKLQTASQVTRIAITTMLEELAPNLWEDDLNRLVDFGHLISPALEMVRWFLGCVLMAQGYIYLMHLTVIWVYDGGWM